ncbi:MAG: LVIVD repeat-containing protein [Terriglobales bacterium]
MNRFRSLLSSALTLALCLGLGLTLAAQMRPKGNFDVNPLLPNDPRVGLAPGLYNPGTAIENLRHVAFLHQPQGFFNPNPNVSGLGSLDYSNSDLAFSGNLVIQGNFHGLLFYNVSNPEKPYLETAVVCPGGQGDVSVYKNLLFVSVESGGTANCSNPTPLPASYLAARRAAFAKRRAGDKSVVMPQRPAQANNFAGIRIFDISNPASPQQVAEVQTCRGSHTNTLVTSPNDPNNVYIYVNGISGVRPAAELAGCNSGGPNDPNSSLYGDYIIQVPLKDPAAAKVVNHARIFASANAKVLEALWKGGNHGTDTQTTAATTACHDVTADPSLGLALGACEGNGLLLNISNPAHPVRITDVADSNFSFWHSASFNNTGTTVVFTDEWGGGTQPRCRATDPRNWGADAIFTLEGTGSHRHLVFDSYYKLAAPQTQYENCVAHNGSLIPVPGRDIMSQAWYQGGASIFDFTNPHKPYEIAYFDRGPINGHKLVLGGYWSVYWYNGYLYGSEIARGLDVFQLTPSRYLTQNEIDAARLAHFDQLNIQDQPTYTWPNRFVVARAYLDQLTRDHSYPASAIQALNDAMKQVKSSQGSARHAAEAKLNGLARRLGAAAGHAANARAAMRMRNAAKVILARDAQLQ